jgi:hypothetical protein
LGLYKNGIFVASGGTLFGGGTDRKVYVYSAGSGERIVDRAAPWNGLHHRADVTVSP